MLRVEKHAAYYCRQIEFCLRPLRSLVTRVTSPPGLQSTLPVPPTLPVLELLKLLITSYLEEGRGLRLVGSRATRVAAIQ